MKMPHLLFSFLLFSPLSSVVKKTKQCCPITDHMLQLKSSFLILHLYGKDLNYLQLGDIMTPGENNVTKT